MPYKLDENMGKEIGTHNGAHYYTIGQRKGLNIGGTPLPLFIIGTDTINNIIYVGQGENHPGLYRMGLSVNKNQSHWIRNDYRIKIEETQHYDCRIRYRQDLTKVKISVDENQLLFSFSELQRGIAPGQFVAWYKNDELIGSGVIN